jgi:hypothetical protein
MKGKLMNGPAKGDVAKDEAPRTVYAGAGSEVVKSAMKKKRGGSVKKAKHVEAHGAHAKHRLDRPARKAGGRVGADMKPFSSAANVKTPAGRDVDSEYD